MHGVEPVLFRCQVIQTKVRSQGGVKRGRNGVGKGEPATLPERSDLAPRLKKGIKYKECRRTRKAKPMN